MNKDIYVDFCVELGFWNKGLNSLVYSLFYTNKDKISEELIDGIIAVHSSIPILANEKRSDPYQLVVGFVRDVKNNTYKYGTHTFMIDKSFNISDRHSLPMEKIYLTNPNESFFRYLVGLLSPEKDNNQVMRSFSLLAPDDSVNNILEEVRNDAISNLIKFNELKKIDYAKNYKPKIVNQFDSKYMFY